MTRRCGHSFIRLSRQMQSRQLFVFRALDLRLSGSNRQKHMRAAQTKGIQLKFALFAAHSETFNTIYAINFGAECKQQQIIERRTQNGDILKCFFKMHKNADLHNKSGRGRAIDLCAIVYSVYAI